MFIFKLEPVFDTAPAASKNEAHVKSGQNWQKNWLANNDLNLETHCNILTVILKNYIARSLNCFILSPANRILESKIRQKLSLYKVFAHANAVTLRQSNNFALEPVKQCSNGWLHWEKIHTFLSNKNIKTVQLEIDRDQSW